MSNHLQILLFVLLFSTLALSHSHSKHSKDDHSHSHDKSSFKIIDQTSQTISEYFKNFSILEQTLLAIMLVSLPSIPVFFVVRAMLRKTTINGTNGVKQILNHILFFSTSVLVSDVLFHLLPEVINSDNSGSETSTKIGWIIYGLFGFLFLDAAISQWFTVPCCSHEQLGDEVAKHKKDQSKAEGYMFLLGDLFHNFTDGIAIGACFNQSLQLGVASSIAIFFHEIPHEISDFAILLNKGYNITQILLTQIFTSVGALIGAIFGLYYGNHYKTGLLCLTISSFLFLSLAQLMNELKTILSATKMNLKNSLIQLAMIYLGVQLMLLIGEFE